MLEAVLQPTSKTCSTPKTTIMPIVIVISSSTSENPSSLWMWTTVGYQPFAHVVFCAGAGAKKLL